ncbi:MAG: hypothetical protein BWK76_27730 [Desulfobulbaceae bacterium A2]|nr:MAG: hypothetical protein BWK76_27730 [Desulfobulbaceae bacterium A2]
MIQRWHYRTVLFEFQKDGLLGDRYLDDEQVATWLNQAGGEGWELVSVSDVKEGLLLILKRPAGEPAAGGVVARTPESGLSSAPDNQRQRLQRQEQEPARVPEEPRRETPHRREGGFIGEIQIR